MSTVVPSAPALAPDRIGPYRLLRPISAGGMARVYEGRLDSLAGVSTRVAVKVIHPDLANEGGFQELFIQEARVSARLEHINVVRVQQFNREGELYYLVMEYIEGVTFRKIVTSCRKHGLRIPPALLAELGRQACDGLHYAHLLGDESGQPLRLVHRDMKPSNLMLNVQGVVKVLDFGISYAHGQQESRGSVKGTWGYMAPEQAEGEAVGGSADLFGLASVLFEVATLEPLFAETDNAAIRRALASDEAARRAASVGGAYAEVGKVLIRALQRDPAARFRSADAMGRALGHLVADPMGARNELVRFVEELRERDRGGAPTSEQLASSASVSTMRVQSPVIPVGPGGLPVVTGGLYAPAKPRKPAPPKPNGGMVSAVFSIAFACFSVGVLVFTGWKIFSSREPVTVATVPPPAIALPVAAVREPVSAPLHVPVPGPAPAVAPPPSAVPEAPVRRPSPTSPEAPPPALAASTSALVAGLASEELPAKVADGTLSISATPRAQVMVDGQFLRFTPLFQHAIPAGPHNVVLITEDKRRKAFRVDVVSGKELRKIWMFDEDRWAEQDAPSP